MTIVRKFQLPAGAQLPSAAQPPEAPQAQAHPHPKTDVEIPEINTNFIDNLFHDPAFIDRFDASFEQTAPMGIEAEKPRQSDAAHDWNMLEMDFSNPPKT